MSSLKLITRGFLYFFCVSLAACFLVFSQSIAGAAEIIGPDVKITNNEITVSAGIALDETENQDLKNGISKEITFYVDLFRVWQMWPDEFVLGKTITNTLRADPVKKEYVATSLDGMTLTEKRFKDLDSLLKWALNVGNLKLANVKSLDAADYFIRLTAESRLRRLPPVISYMFFFVPEKEFRKTKDSPNFRVGNMGNN